MLMKIFIFFCLFVSLFASEIGNILHITDIHYDPYYQVGSPANCYHIGIFKGLGCCHSSNIPISPERKAGKYGDFNCDTPFSLINDTFSWIRNNHELDYIFYTGDTASHKHFSQSKSRNLDVIKDIAELFDYYFSDIPKFNILGNHDTWPVDQFPDYPKNQYWLNNILPYWNKEFTNNSNFTFLRGGYYSQLLNKNLRIIGLNSLYFDSYNILAFNDYDYVNQIKWLSDTLDLANKNNEKVWILGHIYPLGTQAKNSFTLNYNNLFRKYHDIIEFQIWGHLHNDLYTLFSDSEEINSNVIGVGFVSPSLMPDHHRPSYRIYKYDKETSKILDYYQYSADINLANKINKLEYQLDYSALIEYNLDNFYETSWKLLYDKLKSNKTEFNLYYQKYNVGEIIDCDDYCMKEMLCRIRYNDLNSYNKCLLNNEY